MKKYVICTSDYMGDSPSMYSTMAESVKHLILEELIEAEPEDIEEWYGTQDIDKVSDDDVISQFTEENGDGQAYVCIFCVDDDEYVLGG